MTDHRPAIDCHATGERGLMARSRTLRHRLFNSMLRLLNFWRIHAGHLSLASPLLGLMLSPMP